jgi:tetratricopeptide (TPR) repeat protein
MRFLVLLIGFAAFLTLAGPVSVSRAVTDDSDTCAHGSGDAAIAACTQAINSGLWRGSGLAWAYTNRGARYRERGDNDRAIADLSQAVALDPKLAMAYNDRGIAYAVKGDNDRAIADLNQAIALDPKFAKAYNNRGLAYAVKGDNDRAIADEDQAIALDPKYAIAYYNRGFAWEKKNDLQKALADFKKFTELDPADPDGPAAIARVTKVLGQ